MRSGRRRMLLGAGLLALATSCASRRVLVLENRLLEDENTELHRRLREGCASSEDYAAEVDLAVLHGFMERAGFAHTWTAGAKRISMDFRGRNTSFRVTVQHFDEAGVVFLATRDYLRLDQVRTPEASVLLLVTLATLNYELLIGKLQLNPETGEILISSELHVRDGLGYETFVRALESLSRTADLRYPELERAIATTGI